MCFSRNCLCVFSFYMSLFDCKCKSLNRLGENRNKQKQTERNRNKTEKLREKQKNNKNTGYPALDPTANKYLSGSGWEIMYFCFLCLMFFSKLFMFFVCFYRCFFDCKCKSLNRLGENIQNRKKHK